jgi:hypothetical protein
MKNFKHNKYTALMHYSLDEKVKKSLLFYICLNMFSNSTQKVLFIRAHFLTLAKEDSSLLRSYPPLAPLAAFTPWPLLQRVPLS